MADIIAKKAAKRILNDKLGDEIGNRLGGKKANPYPYKWVPKDKYGKPMKKRNKDVNFFMKELHIPEHDAKILAKVMNRARKMDGRSIGPMRFGRTALIQLIPEVGDIITGLISMSIIRTAGQVSGGLDKGFRNKMVFNVTLEVVIGLIPYLGDLGDMFLKANTKNFRELEEMLTKRARALEDAEITGDTHTNNRTHTNGNHHTTGRVHTNGRHEANGQIAAPQDYDDRHAGVHKRLLTDGHQDSKKPTQNSETQNGRGWMNRLQSRGKGNAPAKDAAPSLPHRPAQSNGGHHRISDEDVAPAQPPRAAATRHHQVGSF